MDKRLLYISCLLAVLTPVSYLLKISQTEANTYGAPQLCHFTPVRTVPVHTREFEPIRIRLTALKHSKERMADGDADLAIQAIRAASSKGLSIKDVGNHYVNKDGKVQVAILDNFSSIDQFRGFVSQQMKIDAQAGDTFIVFTIGHGFGGGGLQNMGQREDVMKAIAQAAEENSQKTLWWQLSCHACAKLPGISTLNQAQQELLSIYASSTAADVSAAGVQGKIMEKVFVAIAEKSNTIDPDQDGIISQKELAAFLNTVRSGKGQLLFAKSPDFAIFGQGLNLANMIPIVDRNSPQGTYPKTYIPTPSSSR